MSRRASNKRRRLAYLATVEREREYDPADARPAPRRAEWPMLSDRLLDKERADAAEARLAAVRAALEVGDDR